MAIGYNRCIWHKKVKMAHYLGRATIDTVGTLVWGWKKHHKHRSSHRSHRLCIFERLQRSWLVWRYYLFMVGFKWHTIQLVERYWNVVHLSSKFSGKISQLQKNSTMYPLPWKVSSYMLAKKPTHRRRQQHAGSQRSVQGSCGGIRVFFLHEQSSQDYWKCTGAIGARCTTCR